MKSFGKILGVLVVGVALCCANSAVAGPVGTQGLVDLGPTSVDTGNINTASVFNIGSLLSTVNQTGLFVGMPPGFLGGATINTSVANSMSFSNAAFGSFVSTSISIVSNVPGEVGIYVLGNWTPGTYGAVVGGPYAASVTVAFDQTPAGPGGAISDSLTFAVPPATPPGVPEPASLALLAVGGFGFGCYRRFRKA